MIAGCFPAADDANKKVMVFVCGPVSCCMRVGPNNNLFQYRFHSRTLYTLSNSLLVVLQPPMYNAFCGPREEKDKITGILGDLGYSPDQVYKF